MIYPAPLLRWQKWCGIYVSPKGSPQARHLPVFASWGQSPVRQRGQGMKWSLCPAGGLSLAIFLHLDITLSPIIVGSGQGIPA